MMRHPVILHLVDSLEGGGTERMLLTLLRAADPTRLGHVLVTARRAGAMVEHLPDHVACVACEAVGRRRSLGRRIARIARQTGASVLHARNTGMWPDAIIARMLNPRLRLVLGFHGFDRGDRFTPRQRRIAGLGRLVGARFTTVGMRSAHQLSRETGTPPSRITVLPNGVDFQRFESARPNAPSRVRAWTGAGGGDVVVGIVGSLTKVKRHALLIDAFARAGQSNRRLRLLIVGDGPLRAALTEQVRAVQLTDRVHFAGHIDNVPEALAAMDVYVCASRFESQSNALLEAMAAGVAIVSTDVGDHGLVLEHGRSGWIVPPDLAETLADALLVLSTCPALRARLGDAARVRARAFDLPRCVERYERFYADLVGGCPAAAPIVAMGRLDPKAAPAQGLPAQGRRRDGVRITDSPVCGAPR